jgi:hypothetical protein
MKLHKEIMIQEMTGPVPFELTLGEIISAGDSTNYYHIYVLSLLSQFFKDGYNYSQIGDLSTISSGATSTVAIESIKSLTPSEKVDLATYLLSCINAGESMVYNTQMSSADWIRFVLRRQE